MTSQVAVDPRQRPLRDLRISVTDRCNFRCGYCMPRERFGQDHPFLPRSEVLSYEEISRLARLFAAAGVKKFRVTGGEPLLRHDLSALVAQLRAIEGVEIAMTTNGALLARHAVTLAEAGLDRVTVSLDSVDAATFIRMTDSRTEVSEVLAGIDAAAAAGLGPIKVNTVVRRGVNDHQLVDIARRFQGSGHIVRFIEFMDVGLTNGWALKQVVPSAEVIDTISQELPLEPVEPGYRGEVARRWRYQDGSGEIGVISSVTEPFCGDCTRARLSAKGELFTCLFSGHGTDFREPLRSGQSDAELGALIARVWGGRSDRYSELRSENTRSLPRVEMSHIGG